MDQSPAITRLIQSLKGSSRFSNPKSRLTVSQATTREMSIDTGLGSTVSITGQPSIAGGGGMATLTDPAGNKYAMTNLSGFGQGAVLRQVDG